MATVTTHTGKYTPSFEGAVQRTLASKLEDVVSVADFGAVGDGQVFDQAGTATSGSPNVTVTGASFSAADAGKIISLGRAASGTLTFSDQPASSQTVTLNGVAITFGTDVTIGADLNETIGNLRNFINESVNAELLKILAIRQSATVLLIVYNRYGTDGNSYTIAASGGSNATPSAATLTSGCLQQSTLTADSSGTTAVMADDATVSASSISVAYGTDSAAAINAALNQKGKVVLPKGIFITTEPILIGNGMRLVGDNSSSPDHGGSIIMPAAGFAGNVIETTETSGTQYHHWMHLLNLQLRCHFQESGNGMHLFRLGENSIVDLCIVIRAAGHGIQIYDSCTPMHIGKVSLHGCGWQNDGYGLYLKDSIYTANQIEYVAGDNCGRGLIGVTNLYRSNLTLLSMKTERWLSESAGITAVKPGNRYGLECIDLNGGVVNCLGFRPHNTASAGRGQALIRNATSSGSRGAIQMLSGIQADEATQHALYDYDDGTNQIAWNVDINQGMRWYEARGAIFRMPTAGGGFKAYAYDSTLQTGFAVQRRDQSYPQIELLSNGRVRFGTGSAAGTATIGLQAGQQSTIEVSSGATLKIDGTYTAPLRLGSRLMWWDSSGNLRAKNGSPSNETDGTVISAATVT